MSASETVIVSGYDTVENWLSRLSENSRDKEKLILNLFLSWSSLNGGQFASMTPDDLVEYQRNASTNGERYKVLDLVQRYINGLSGLRFKTKQKYYGTVRSFFDHNRAELPGDKSFQIRGDVEPVRGTLTVDEFRKALLASKPRYRAILLSMFQGSLDYASFAHWNMKGKVALLEALKGDPDAIQIHLPGRKATRNKQGFYTFIGRDAIAAIRHYNKTRKREEARKTKKAKKEGRTYTPDPDAIFIDQFGGPIKYSSLRMYWGRLLKRLGLIEPKGGFSGNRYGKNLHELRDLFKSRSRLSGVDKEIPEYFMGHGLDRYGYDKSPQHNPEWFHDQYVLMQPWLNILSEDPLKVPAREMDAHRLRIQELEAEINRLQAERTEGEAIASRLEKTVTALIERVEKLEKE